MTLAAPYLKNTIVLLGKGQHEEYPASTGTIKPGHLQDVFVSSGVLKVKRHDRAGGRPARYFAKENALLGKWIDDVYTSGEPVAVHIADEGDIVQGRVAAACPAIALGDWLVSAGDGTPVEPASLGSHTLFAAAAPSTALNTMTTLAPFDVSYTIPANTLQVGDILHIKATVLFANASDAGGTVLITLKIGTVVIIATAAVDNGAADIARIEAQIHVRAVGSSGSIVAQGTQALGAPGTATALPWQLAATTLNTTIAEAVTVNQTCSASHANNGGQLMDLTVEISRVAPSELMFQAEEAVDNSGGSAEALIPVRVVA